MEAQTAIGRTGPTSQRSIDYDRFERACTEPMNVRFDGPDIADVTYDNESYRVELASSVCECDDYYYRGDSVFCKHVLRAAFSALYANQRVTELVARVARFARDAGCVYGVRRCAGPTDLGERGYPCSGCVRATRYDDWAVWASLVSQGYTSTSANTGVGR